MKGGVRGGGGNVLGDEVEVFDDSDGEAQLIVTFQMEIVMLIIMGD